MSRGKQSVKPRRGSKRPTYQDPRKLRRVRTVARLTPSQLADKLKISKGHYSEIEAIPPTRSASPALLGRIADELGCDITDLMSDDEPHGRAA